MVSPDKYMVLVTRARTYPKKPNVDPFVHYFSRASNENLVRLQYVQMKEVDKREDIFQ